MVDNIWIKCMTKIKNMLWYVKRIKNNIARHFIMKKYM